MRNTKKRGISPVIATVILVAIAIVISIAAAFWMTGLLTSFTAYEKLTIYVYLSKSGSEYDATITIVNDGTASAVVTKILINGEDKTNLFKDDQNNTPPNAPIGAGESKVFTGDKVVSGVKPGQIVRITIVTLRGTYETTVVAP
ncbi:MAG: DUF4352 domain-containing protein [archaeon YNP-LCB-003-016]|uniref:archaellin/type IV pilin N-terminal domain-containing protein n=1 Tax=Candidatus Culexarchaeum yellowstonense TaxID=2928963 RepID=UPI0026EE0213|nr:archaellin/type IV pilin N-terminal domain-containing protein [Candidatus Culexarchaeum yellowstonense]MCR6692703.1 DUF4352 domain-containing protein [Candidatus Culexarchaeum yellowstonense]